LFTHLHVHSNYSLKEGAATVTDLAQTAASSGMEAIALTDHDGLYGAVRFTLACQEAGVRPILGSELEWGDGYHVTLLVKDAKGWSNLCHLVTEMHLSERAQSLEPGKRPRTTFEAIARYSDGLVALSGCEKGEVPWLMTTGRSDDARAAAKRWHGVFGEDFVVELSNFMRPEDRLRARNLHDLAKQTGLPLAATNDVHYTEESDAVIHEVLDATRRIVPLSRSTASRRNAEYWLKPEFDMALLHPQEALLGAAKVAERCTYQLPLGEFHFPDLPEERGGPRQGQSATELLARRCFEGINRRLGRVTTNVEERLQSELRTIRKGGFCGYFLLVADIVSHAKNQLGIRCACRGSAAGSLVAFTLGISDVDPIRHDLAFERFMNPYRREIPDIDIDFESARRHEILDYILETYGDRTAVVAMMETFRARAALREVGKAMGLVQTEIDTIAKAFPRISADKIPQALETLPEVKQMNLKASKLESLFEICSRLEGFPRHLALHPSGVILSDEKLGDLMPMQNSYEGFLMSQFDKDDVEALGIAKLDVLGVRMLSAMSHALDEVLRLTGERPDIDEPNKDDEGTFQLIRETRTMGCFQIESPGQHELLGKFQPTEFSDLIVDISLFRPGPVKSDMVRPFLERRHGWKQPTYDHPSLKEILKETHGVIVFHEQVMRVISAMSGKDLSYADHVRRSLDKDEVAAELGKEIIAAAIRRGWDASTADKVWNDVARFAAFGFCKAHAAAFAVPTYQSAWLKTHYPTEFYAGLLTHDPGMYPKRAILADARAHEVPILGVDINVSPSAYTAELPTVGRKALRMGLMDVRGISSSEIDSIIEGRPWRSFGDFCRRVEVSRPVTEALVSCGAFDPIKGKRARRELLWELGERWVERTRERKEQLSLDLSLAEPIRLPGIADFTDQEKVEAELEVLGLDVCKHIISFFQDELAELGWTPASDLLKKRSNAQVVVAGVKVATQSPPIRSGKRVIFLTLEDGTGQSNVAFFEEALQTSARRIFDGWILAVKGTVRRAGARGVSVLGEEVIDLRSKSPGKLWHASQGSAG
jgi:error-prone DNA polymerase